MISSISSLEVINFVIPDPFFFQLAPPVSDDAAVNPNSIKTLLANVLSTFFIKDKLVFSDGPRNLPKNRLDCLILCSCLLDKFILAD